MFIVSEITRAALESDARTFLDAVTLGKLLSPRGEVFGCFSLQSSINNVYLTRYQISTTGNYLTLPGTKNHSHCYTDYTGRKIINCDLLPKTLTPTFFAPKNKSIPGVYWSYCENLETNAPPIPEL